MANGSAGYVRNLLRGVELAIVHAGQEDNLGSRNQWGSSPDKINEVKENSEIK